MNQTAMAPGGSRNGEPARSSARMTSRAVRPAAAGSCRQGNGDLANPRGFTYRNWFATGRAVLDHQADGVLGHRQRRALVAAEGDDLGKQRHPDGESAFLFRLEHDCEGALLIGCHDLLSITLAVGDMK